MKLQKIHNNFKRLFLIIFLTFFVFLTGCSSDQSNNNQGDTPGASEEANGQDIGENDTTDELGGQNATTTESIDDQKNEEDKESLSDNENIEISGIEEGDNITSPVTIKGEGKSADNTLIVELRNSDHEALVQEPVSIKSANPGEKGEFEITLKFIFNNTEEGYIAVYEQGENESEKNLVEIPVKYNQEEADVGDWKTYKNVEARIEFKYPNDWTETKQQINDKSCDNKYSSFLTSESKKESRKEFLENCEDCHYPSSNIVYLNIYESVDDLAKCRHHDNNNYLGLKEFLVNHYQKYDRVDLSNGIVGYKVVRQDLNNYKEVFVKKGEKVVVFSIVAQDFGTTAKNMNIFNKILQSFKFINN